MSLSEQEQRTLQEIERSLLAEDPTFASSMPRVGAAPASGEGRLTMRSLALIVLGLVLLLGGVALATVNIWLIALSVVGFLVMLGGGVMALRTPSAAQGVSRKVARPTVAPPRTSKMEENFRRRFEGQ